MKLNQQNQKILKILALFALLFFFLRFYHLESLVAISGDQGKYLLEVYKIFQEKRLQLIGPIDESKIIDGRGFFIGPLYYYFLLPVLAISNWNILSASVFLVFLSFLGGIFLFFLAKDLFGLKVATIALFLFCFAPFSVEYSRFIWNPNFFLFLSPCLAYLVNRALRTKRMFWLLIAGVTAGVGFQFHYTFFFIMVLTGLIIIWLTKEKIKSLWFFSLGIILGYLPLILFELRHDFYNLNTILLFVQKWPDQQRPFWSLIPRYVFPLEFSPIIILFFALILKRVEKWQKGFFYLALIGFLTYSLFQVNPLRSQAFGMPQGWSYPGMQKVEKIILSDVGNRQYNLVSLISGDVREFPLRFMLLVKNRPPLWINQYPDSEALYVISDKSPEEVTASSLWEIRSFLPAEIAHVWEIQNGIFLYKLVKQ